MSSLKPVVIPFFTGIYSQWYLVDFIVDNIRFNCSEQYMMYSKAMLFNDLQSSYKILSLKLPKDHLQAGRRVIGFKENIWIENRERIAYEGNYAKFAQNKSLKKELLSTGNAILAEASTIDKIWGAGLGENDPKVMDPNKWEGLSLLGKTLMRIREDLRKEV